MSTQHEVTLATWFHADDHPDRHDTGEEYLRCIDVCVASFRRWNPRGRALVVLNPQAVIDRARLQFWRELGIVVLRVANTHRAPGAPAAWDHRYFLFDVVRAVAEACGDDTPVAIVNGASIVRRNLADIALDAAEHGRTAMSVGYGENQPVHGLTRDDLRALMERQTGTRLDFVPEYLGSEFVAGTPTGLRALLPALETAYGWAEAELRTGDVLEEGHVLSIAAPTRACDVRGNGFAERIWTQPWAWREYTERVGEVAIWYAPAERRTGFPALRAKALDRRSWFWTANEEEWRSRVARAIGVPNYGMTKALSDARRLAPRAARTIIGRMSSAGRTGGRRKLAA